jgi:glycosyltransferase involved in cell wall biosynthesis
VTVVIPVWDDYVAFLPEAVESVKRNAPAAPTVVVDNASTTPVPRLPGSTVIRAPRRLSAGAARNLGLEQVATEYVVFLDADDMLLSGTLEFMCSRISADPSLAIFVTSVLDGETGERHRTPRRFVPALSRRPRVFALTNCVWSLLPLQGCAIMRAAEVREAGGYADADWGEDWVLGVSLSFRGRVEVNPRLGRYYRATPGSLWRRPRPSSELRASARRVRERLRSDSGVPAWARALLPAIALFQLVAVHVVRPVYLLGRRLAGRSSRLELEPSASSANRAMKANGENQTR